MSGPGLSFASFAPPYGRRAFREEAPIRRLFRVIARRNNQPGIRCGEPVNDFSDERVIVHDYVQDHCAAFVVEHRACAGRPPFNAAARRRWRESHD